MVIFTPPKYLVFGVSPIPGATNGEILPFDVSSVIVPGWKNLDIVPERLAFGTMILGLDYSWNKSTCLWALLKPDDKFAFMEAFNVTFLPLTTNQTSSDLTNGNFAQYPHTLKYSVKVNGTATEITEKCRYEYASKTIVSFNTQNSPDKGIIYQSSGVTDKNIDLSIDVYDGNKLLITDKVKQFRRGLLNARIWI